MGVAGSENGEAATGRRRSPVGVISTVLCGGGGHILKGVLRQGAGALSSIDPAAKAGLELLFELSPRFPKDTYLTSNISTSNISGALGLMMCPAPRSP